jgi:hypothetical protein
MHTNQTVYRGFIKTYGKPQKKLTMPVDILPVSSSDNTISNTPVKINAIWDTGATLTIIKPELRNRLNLCMVRAGSSATVVGLGGLFKADYTVLSIYLRDNFEIEWCPVYVLDFSVDVDMIIGMDIIGMGDFAVCNTNNETSFTFAVPSFPDRINFADKSEIFNKQ